MQYILFFNGCNFIDNIYSLTISLGEADFGWMQQPWQWNKTQTRNHVSHNLSPSFPPSLPLSLLPYFALHGNLVRHNQFAVCRAVVSCVNVRVCLRMCVWVCVVCEHCSASDMICAVCLPRSEQIHRQGQDYCWWRVLSVYTETQSHHPASSKKGTGGEGRGREREAEEEGKSFLCLHWDTIPQSAERERERERERARERGEEGEKV